MIAARILMFYFSAIITICFVLALIANIQAATYGSRSERAWMYGSSALIIAVAIPVLTLVWGVSIGRIRVW